MRKYRKKKRSKIYRKYKLEGMTELGTVVHYEHRGMKKIKKRKRVNYSNLKKEPEQLSHAKKRSERTAALELLIPNSTVQVGATR